ncbi:MAG: glycosyltransferase [Planctomycetota bacterium]|jgi:glycosyltransferase involved in cell wall biosynthesis
MRILFLSSVYPSRTEATRGTYNRDLCHALADTSDVRVISPVSWIERLRNADACEAEEAEPVESSRPLYWYPPRILRHHYGTCMWHSIRRHVAKTIDDFQPDWVLSYWAHPDGEAALEAAEMCGARSGVIIGGSDVLLLTKDARRRDAICRVLREVDAVFTVCDGLRERVIELGGSAERTHTTYQGIDATLFSQGSQAEARQQLGVEADVPLFLWVGRIVAVKRLDVLLTAFREVRRVLPCAKLRLVGSGNLTHELQTFVRQNELNDSVEFVGPVDRRMLARCYRAADATVLSSDSEGLPNVLRESLACGTPFVSTDVGSVREIAHETHSQLVPRGDSDALHRAMLQVLDSSFKDGALAYQPLSWQDAADRFVAIMNRTSDAGTLSAAATTTRPTLTTTTTLP